MVRFKWLSLLIIAVVTCSCQKKLPELQGFDREAWVSDKNGCSNKRAQMANILQTEKEKLLALSELEIVELLGRPDQNELSKRHQKLYGYYLFPAKACGQAAQQEQRLIIRFNAMGLAKEVSIE